MATVEGRGLGGPGALSGGRRLSRKPLRPAGGCRRRLTSGRRPWANLSVADVSEASNGFAAVGVASEPRAFADPGVAASSGLVQSTLCGYAQAAMRLRYATSPRDALLL